MENRMIQDRIRTLRNSMKQHGIDYYLMTTEDFHCSEYVNEAFRCREHFSGFTGSNGNLLVSATKAGLWTDGRYFVQAEKELEGTGITLFRMLNEGVETLEEYLQHHAEEGQCLGFDGRCVNAAYGRALEKALSGKKMHFAYRLDLAGEIWADRPAFPKNPVWLLDETRCGRTAEEKLALVRDEMKRQGAGYLILSKLDDLMWLTNVRGNDVTCNPVALSYGIIGLDSFVLYLQPEEVTAEAADYFRNKKITIRAYNSIYTDLEQMDFHGERVMLDPQNISFTLMQLAAERASLVEAPNPTEWYKAVKTPQEMEQIREAYLEDSAAVCRFIYWLKQQIGHIRITEMSAAEKIDSLRAEISDFVELSFPTISAYRENAAMMHYEATAESDRELEPEGMLLVDSGGQYLRGTTDVTRTIVLGKISDEIRKHFTRTAAGMLQMADAHFLYGCGGRNVDILAREPLWELGIDYKCGTGHGIGYLLNVHEGPQGARWKYTGQRAETPLEEGMLLSDEPGVYVAGSHGIRTENILEVCRDVHNSDGQFMRFDMLTYVPVDREAIDPAWLSERDLERLNRYHAAVYEKIAPFLPQEEQSWLKEVTAPITK